MSQNQALTEYLLRLADTDMVLASACANGAARRRPWKKKWR
jgi:hypothetical protein